MVKLHKPISMQNNDILRRLRYIFSLSDSKMIEIFSHVELSINRAQISNWLKKEEDAEFTVINESKFSAFLDGLIIEMRGKQEGSSPIQKSKLNNNVILRKLKIALNYRDDDVIQVLRLGDFNLSKHELSAFFRNPTHQHYRLCKDQVIRNFLNGLQQKYFANSQSNSFDTTGDQVQLEK